MWQGLLLALTKCFKASVTNHIQLLFVVLAANLDYVTAYLMAQTATADLIAGDVHTNPFRCILLILSSKVYC